MTNPLTEPDQFLRWKEHHLTQAFHQFLKDRVQTLAMQWAERSVPSDHPSMTAAQVQAETLGDLASMTIDDIREFYGLEGANNEHQRN